MDGSVTPIPTYEHTSTPLACDRAARENDTVGGGGSGMHDNRAGIQAEQSVTGIQANKPMSPMRPPALPPLTCKPQLDRWLKWIGIVILGTIIVTFGGSAGIGALVGVLAAALWARALAAKGKKTDIRR
jgi:hypothetical protein